MEPKEIDVKIDICRHLGIVPVFAVRWNKPYVNCVYKQGGFRWFFKMQMFPIGQEKLVNQLVCQAVRGAAAEVSHQRQEQPAGKDGKGV